ncbi:MAG: antibiotic biosynthesis monooxygenase [Pseudoxanthomonas sp.]
MILEIAVFDIAEGHEAAFEGDFQRAREVLAMAPGHRSNELLRSHERPSQYALLVRWDTIEDHVRGFRGSGLFARWRELLQPHFGAAPEVVHYLPTTDGAPSGAVANTATGSSP